MNITLECYPCLANQADKIIRKHLCKVDHLTAMRELLEIMAQSNYPITAPEITASFFEQLRVKYGLVDPYLAEKQKNNQWIKERLPLFRERINQHSDPLRAALGLAAAGNVIDLGVPGTFDINKLLLDAELEPFAIDHTEIFRAQLEKATSILVIGDNAGEIGLDRLLLEIIRDQYAVTISYLVRGGPILNDATQEDADFFQLSDIASVVHNGTQIPGTCPERVPLEVKRLLYDIDIILAKGQGNYETLNVQIGRGIFFLLITKCKPVADTLKVKVGARVLDFLRP